MKKIDFKKVLSTIYKPSPKTVDVVEIPQMNFLMIDGEGNPNNSASFRHAIEALFALSYALKFMVKKSDLQIDYAVMPLEGLWWADDISSFNVENKDDWKWTLMIMQPDMISEQMVQDAIEQVTKKKNPVAISLVRFESLFEGKSAQIMHHGPFSEEGPTVDKVHNFIEENGYQLRGQHHEIYLSDIRKAAPEKWKTIIRQPIVSR